MKIKRTNKLKTNSSGFGHIEMLLLVVAVVVIGGVGFFVYNNSNKKTATKSTAHAGSYTTIDKGRYCTNNSCSTSISFTAQACYTNAGAYGSYVKVLIGLSSPTPYPNNTQTIITNYQSQSIPTKINSTKTETGNWLYGAFHTSNAYLINPKVNNFIAAYPIGPNTSTIGAGYYGSPQNVTVTWVHATGLKSC